MIARTWRGWTHTRDAHRYVDYVRRTGLAAYQATAGNRGAVVLRRTDGERTEFFVVSLWDSMDSVRRFAGPEPDRAVFYPEDDRFLVARETHVDHYEVADGVPFTVDGLGSLPPATRRGSDHE